MKKRIIKRAFIDTIPVLTGYLFLGMGFGIMLQTKGYGVLWALPMSITMFAGAMQYVAVDLLANGATFLTSALTTLMVNARHLFYGISLIDKYKGAGVKKAYMMFGLTDETYSLVSRDHPTEEAEIYTHSYYFLVTLFNQLYWVTGCSLGALLGGALPFNTEGIDFVLTALFLSICTEQWISTKNHKPALIGFATTLICLLIFGPNNFLIPAMAVILGVLSFGRSKIA